MIIHKLYIIWYCITKTELAQYMQKSVHYIEIIQL